MFRKRDEPKTDLPAPSARVTSVLGTGIAWKGAIHGSGGVRIEGAFDGEIALKGLLVISETGRITCPHILANTVIVSGAVQGN
ncbi:MAG: polymer-forming cytoskeletal protein, partial [Anaerolineales bacterium]|nr:polymer-forming cytoskeletal protein [Anaerolineales bacterium]